jgi:SAM-dependent methyltransferase
LNTSPSASGPPEPQGSFWAGCELFGISLLLLFLEMACIRWFPAHVIFLTFFTNTVLLACFLGMSVGCLAAGRARNLLAWTPLLLLAALAAAHGVEESWQHGLPEWLSPLIGQASGPRRLQVPVGNPTAPEFVFFGTEQPPRDLAAFAIPVEVLGGAFFLLVALTLMGPCQELGRAQARLPRRVYAYTLNILGSVAGVVLFAACSWWEVPPLWWFLGIALGLGYFLAPAARQARGLIAWLRFGFQLASLAGVVYLASWTSGPARRLPGGDTRSPLWSPYYRIDYDPIWKMLKVNLIGHQQMISCYDDWTPAFGYALPHVLNRDSGRLLFGDVLIIGAGSGNDVSRALQWGARHVDAVEIDPAILRLGRLDHPDLPYQDERVHVILDDGRHYLRTCGRQYDLIVYALVDSLVLHSSYSNLRLESYLFTREAFADVRRCLKPDGVFVMQNYFREGWIVARLRGALAETFEDDPLVFTFPYRETVRPEQKVPGYTVFFAHHTQPLRQAFERQPVYLFRLDQPPAPDSPNGFGIKPPPEEADNWHRIGPTEVVASAGDESASDDWPFLYLRGRMIPDLSRNGMAIMAIVSGALLLLFLPGRRGKGWRVALNPRMFFLGAGFMLIETKAVVHLALLFGSTWMVNAVVFLAVLGMILAANLYVLAVRPTRLGVYYAALLAALLLGSLLPLNVFLGWERYLQVIGSCLLVFAPILLAGVIFAVSFGRSADPDGDFGANIAGAILGGLAENASLLLGFQYLGLLAGLFYALSVFSVAPKNSEKAG